MTTATRAEAGCPLGLKSVDRLSPFQRTLAMADGTVTSMVEAYAGERLHVTIEPTARKADAPTADERRWLELASRQHTFARRSYLTGEDSQRLYVSVYCLIVPDRLPSQVRVALLAGEAPIGRILQEHRMETFREILEINTERARIIDPWLGAWALFSRTYRLISGGRPMMLITEWFWWPPS